MTDNTKEYHPDFNEFWDELIRKSEWAKDNAGKISVEFKNLGVLQPKPIQQQKQADPLPINGHAVKPIPATIDYMQKILSWLIIVLISIVITTLVFYYFPRPKQSNCVINRLTWGYLGKACSIIVPDTENSMLDIDQNVKRENVECLNQESWNPGTQTCESAVEPMVDPNATTSNGETEKNIQGLEKDELKASVIKSLFN